MVEGAFFCIMSVVAGSSEAVPIRLSRIVLLLPSRRQDKAWGGGESHQFRIVGPPEGQQRPESTALLPEVIRSRGEFSMATGSESVNAGNVEKPKRRRGVEIFRRCSGNPRVNDSGR